MSVAPACEERLRRLDVDLPRTRPVDHSSRRRVITSTLVAKTLKKPKVDRYLVAVNPGAMPMAAASVAVALSDIVNYLLDLLERSPGRSQTRPAGGADVEERLLALSPPLVVPTRAFAPFTVNPQGDPWDWSEVHRQVSQMAVLQSALARMENAQVFDVAPTQQKGVDAWGTNAKGAWSIEAFGGGNVTNNRKRQKDIARLDKYGSGMLIFACWARAWRDWRSEKWQAPSRDSIPARGVFSLRLTPKQPGRRS
jgi:hypothetical protein